MAFCLVSSHYGYICGVSFGYLIGHPWYLIGLAVLAAVQILSYRHKNLTYVVIIIEKITQIFHKTKLQFFYYNLKKMKPAIKLNHQPVYTYVYV